VVIDGAATEPLNRANSKEPDRFTLLEVPVGVRSGLERTGDGRNCRSTTIHVHGTAHASQQRGHGNFVYTTDDGRRWIVELDDTEDSGKSVYTPAWIAT
jgi:hypothetical protein